MRSRESERRQLNVCLSCARRGYNLSIGLTIARASPYLQSQIRKRDGGSLTLLVHSLNLFPKKGLILYDLSNLNRYYSRQSNRIYPTCNLFAHLRSEEPTPEIQSLRRISYAVYFLNKDHYITAI